TFVSTKPRIEQENVTDIVTVQQDRLKRAIDNHGCDALVDSCGSKGACCDEHDDCYAQHGCTACSWIWSDSPCDSCNNEVMQCITWQNPGPSRCCAAGNCGQKRQG
ncbi:unnamed protein product, partial [Didymodactylos carnosus]